MLDGEVHLVLGLLLVDYLHISMHFYRYLRNISSGSGGMHGYGIGLGVLSLHLACTLELSLLAQSLHISSPHCTQ
jgi:hypothetical protein